MHTTDPSTAAVDSAELRLLLAAARWPQGAADQAEVRTLFSGPLDLTRFLRLVAHHRLTPLVSHSLSASLAGPLAPDRQEVLQQLRNAAAANTFRALRSIKELRRLITEFHAAGIPVRVLKGLPLALQVFGDISLRATGDLDLLIPEECIVPADRILRGAGYEGLFEPNRFSPSRLAFYRSHWKDISYRHPRTGEMVDLHWRCFRNSEMPGTGICDAAAPETVEFGSFQVATLPLTEGLLYLCVHGTLDGWLYFKSLADVAARVRTMPTAHIDSLAALAIGYGILPELSAALLLCRRYFGMDHWSDLLLGPTHPTVDHILRFAQQSLEKNDYLTEREQISSRSMLAFEIGLRRTFAYRMELLLRILFRARMWDTIPLPDYLFGVYPLLSPVEWLVFRLRQWRQKSPPALRSFV
jgi:hypothetical protein